MTFDAVGSGDGVRRFIAADLPAAEQIDFGASDSAMTDAELDAAGGHAVMVPVTGGCVALVYNLPPAVGTLKLSREVMASIFLGDIGAWSDPRIVRLNPALAGTDLSIRRIVREDRSGTTFALTSHLAAVSDIWRRTLPPATEIAWPGTVVRAAGSDGVARQVTRDAGAISYVGLETARALKLTAAAVQNKKGEFIRPSPESCTTALETWDLPENLRAFVPDPDGLGAYPISTLSWVLLRTTGADGGGVRSAMTAFFRWCLQEGQSYSAAMGYVPLPSEMATKALDALDRASVGRR
jgi:phosphate transport system substrate-binding protein